MRKLESLLSRLGFREERPVRVETDVVGHTVYRTTVFACGAEVFDRDGVPVRLWRSDDGLSVRSVEHHGIDYLYVNPGGGRMAAYRGDARRQGQVRDAVKRFVKRHRERLRP